MTDIFRIILSFLENKDKESWKRTAPFLRELIEKDDSFQEVCLYEAESLFESNPKVKIHQLFQNLEKHQIVSGRAFLNWIDSKKSTSAKPKALMMLNPWLSTVKDKILQDEEEEGDDVEEDI